MENVDFEFEIFRDPGPSGRAFLSLKSKSHLAKICDFITRHAEATGLYTQFRGVTNGGRNIMTFPFASLGECGAFLQWMKTGPPGFYFDPSTPQIETIEEE